MRSLPQLTPLAVFGMAGTTIFLFVAVFAPWLAPYPISQVVGGVWENPSHSAWFGTDNIGRDLFSRIIWGARITLAIAAIATTLAFMIGVSLGFIAALARGWIDQILSRLVDLMMSIPTLIFPSLSLQFSQREQAC